MKLLNEVGQLKVWVILVGCVVIFGSIALLMK